jgi:hypothetical protein
MHCHYCMLSLFRDTEIYMLLLLQQLISNICVIFYAAMCTLHRPVKDCIDLSKTGALFE